MNQTPPRTPEALSAYFTTAVRAQQQGDHARAEAAYRSILAVVPQHLDTAHNLAVLLGDQQRYGDALMLWQAVLAAAPGNVDAHIEIALTRIRMGDAEGAKNDLIKAANIAPADDDVWRRIASGFVLIRDFPDAVDAYTEALNCNPQEPRNYTAFASLCSHLGEYTVARELAQNATQLAPDLLWAWIELGNAQMKEGDRATAAESFRQAIRIAPEDPVGYCNLAITQMEEMDLEAASVSLDQALALDPEHPLSRWNRALVRLTLGRLREAWPDYEYRRQANIQGVIFRPTTPQWRGEPLAGKRILLLCEQGLGDSIQFIRYARMVKERGAWVAVRIQAPLKPLFRGLPEIDLLIDETEAVPETDLHCHLLSLPLAFHTGLDDIPAQAPYLHPPEDAQQRWQAKLAVLPSPRVGLVWAGGKRQHMADAVLLDKRRSLQLEQLLPLAAIPGIEFVSLQKDAAAAQVAELADRWSIHDYSADLADFAETAALIQQVDLVISVDTAVAHLAGALGKPIWLLNRWDTDWRWLLNREDSPWYPSLRQFRQPRPDDWEGAISALASALRQWSVDSKPGPRNPADRVATLLRQGEQQFKSGDAVAAEKSFAEAARLAPDAWQIHFNLGMCRDRLGQRESAFKAYEAAHRLAPDNVPCLTNLAVNAFNLGKPELALQLTLRQVELEPTNAFAYDNLGQIFRHLGQYEAAELSLQNALLLAPSAPTIHNNLGLVLMDQNKQEAAESAFRAALQHDPEHVDAFTNLSCVYQALGRIDDALALYRKAVELAPGSGVTWTNLGNALKAMGQYDEALEAQRRAVELAPAYPLAHWNYGISLLTMGRFEEGWKEYEWGAAAGTRTTFGTNLPRWQGESIDGKHLLLRAEQGLGDTLQFVRFARKLQGSGAHVTLECQAPLLELLVNCPGIDRVVPQSTELPADAYGCDLYLPLMSLPYVLSIRLPDLPGPIPYLHAAVANEEKWRRILGEKLHPRIGLVWAGNPLHRNDRQRSCALPDLAPVLALPGVELVSLQMGCVGTGLPAGLRNVAENIGSFADTAALIEQLDLVIAVDTAIVHLAGGLGRPVWLMVASDADWRWLRDRDDSPWYPTLTLYRQKLPGQWLPVAERIAADLEKRLGTEAS